MRKPFAALSVALLSVLSCHDQAPLPPDRIVVVAGNNQMAEPLQALSVPLTVELQSADGTPVSNVTVRWTIQTGPGALAANAAPAIDATTQTLTTTTSSDGRAQVWLRLGETVGAVQVSARTIEWPPRSAAFTARAMNVLIMRYDGTRWSTGLADSTEYSRSLRAIWGTSRTGIAALGTCGAEFTSSILLRYDGSAWQAETLPVPGIHSGNSGNDCTGSTSISSSKPSALGGRSMSDVFALVVTLSSSTWKRHVLENDGSGWRSSLTRNATPPNYERPNGIWFGTGKAAYVVLGSDVAFSPNGEIERYDGSTWSSVHADAKKSFLAIWGTAENDITVVGKSGAIIHFDGASWVSQSSPTTRDLRSVHGLTSTNVMAVGDGGAIVHYDGNAWTPENSGTTANLYCVYMLTPTSAFAVGDSGVVVKYDGSKWTPTTVNPRIHFRGVWAASESDVFAVGAPRR